MAQFEIGPKNFIAGESSADDVGDRGFSPASYGLNLTKKRGMLHFVSASASMGGSTLVGNIVASAIDPTLFGKDAHHLDDEGNFYSLSGSVFNLKQTASGAGTFGLGTSDLFPFMNEIFATSTTAIYKLPYDMSSLVNWWDGLTSGYRHCIERIEDEMFIANRNVIYYWNGTSSGTAFTLPTDVAVTSLRRHPDGRTLLAFCSENDQNFSHALGGGGYVYYCDPTVRDWTREVKIEAQVEGTKLHGGVVYCTYGKSFGYFDGNGLQFLKRLENSATTYSHSINSIDEILIVRDGTYALAYGDLGAGNVWWRFYKNDVNTQDIQNILSIGSNEVLLTFSDAAGGGRLQLLDLDDIGSSGVFYTNRFFEEESVIKRIELLHDTTASSRFYIYHRDVADTETELWTETTAADTNRTRIDMVLQTDLAQIKLAPQNDDLGFKRIRIKYAAV